MLVHWVWLAELPLTAGWKMALIEYFHDPEELYYKDDGAFSQFPDPVRSALKDRDLTKAEGIISKCREKRIGIMTVGDGAYPARLKNIADPPIVLYYRGVQPDFDGVPAIAVVGTRECTAYGIGVAKRMGYQIAKCGAMVVSGVASGIDGMAMRGALSAEGLVVGVVGGGVDVVYPKGNRDLYEDLERRGCLISEYPPESPALGWHFPRRNRIISGICCGVLVVEAPLDSGALITARHAAEQGRDVFVVPGNVDVPSCEGSNALLREGAIAARSGWDVVGEYENQYPVKKYIGGNHQTSYSDEIKPLRVAEKPVKIFEKPKNTPDKKDIDKEENIPYSDWNEKISFLSGTEKSIVAFLEAGDKLVDEVIAGCGTNAGAVLAALTLLEIKGIVCRLPGKKVGLKRR